MTDFTYYRNEETCTWRFTTLRSGQPAASDRSLRGGNPIDPALCRTPL